ncbi:MAG: YdbL family protein [Methylophilaceae bacterium]
MKKSIVSFLVLLVALFSVNWASAEADLEINTPAINALKASMQGRHNQLAPHYNSGAVGLTKDGFIAVRDTTAVPLKDRQGINGLVTAENTDRAALYKEIANANKHPEWESSIRDSFAGRWIDKAQGGWWVQGAGGWVKK